MLSTWGMLSPSSPVKKIITSQLFVYTTEAMCTCLHDIPCCWRTIFSSKSFTSWFPSITNPIKFYKNFTPLCTALWWQEVLYILSYCDFLFKLCFHFITFLCNMQWWYLCDMNTDSVILNNYNVCFCQCHGTMNLSLEQIVIV
jgi:hypothetical protein